MYVRQVKRKCSVRGCKNTECFAISRNREVGNTVIICKSCLEEALGAIDEIDPKTKSNIPKIDNTAAPALFFNAKALSTETDTTAISDIIPPEDASGGNNATIDDAAPDASETDAEADEASADDVTELSCPACGKKFDSEKGLKTHLRYCKQE